MALLPLFVAKGVFNCGECDVVPDGTRRHVMDGARKIMDTLRSNRPATVSRGSPICCRVFATGGPFSLAVLRGDPPESESVFGSSLSDAGSRCFATLTHCD